MRELREKMKRVRKLIETDEWGIRTEREGEVVWVWLRQMKQSHSVTWSQHSIFVFFLYIYKSSDNY